MTKETLVFGMTSFKVIVGKYTISLADDSIAVYVGDENIEYHEGDGFNEFVELVDFYRREIILDEITKCCSCGKEFDADGHNKFTTTRNNEPLAYCTECSEWM